MKNKMKILIGVAAVMLAMVICSSASSILLNGNTVTNANAKYTALTSGTNSSGVVTNNFQVGQVPGASNVLWQLNTSYGAQPYLGTNGYLPAFVLDSGGGYPGSLSGPSRMVSIEISGNLMATNATSTAVVFRFAASDSGIVWYTNWYVTTYTIPVNATTDARGCILTNIDFGANEYIALQAIENPGVAAMTNIVIDINCNPGL